MALNWWSADDAVTELWGRLPSWMKWHRTVRTTLVGESDTGPVEPWVDKSIEEANLILSTEHGSSYGVTYHRPVLDLDFEAELVPSSTPGHFHLYLNRQVSQDAYWKMLESMANAGILQRGFVDAAKERGATSVRLPWIKKNDWAANQGDPLARQKDLRSEIAELKARLSGLEQELDRALPF